MPAVSLSGPEDIGNYRGVEVRAAAVLTASYEYSKWIDVRLFESVDWLVFLTARGSITRLDLQIQFTCKQSPNETTDWATLQAEDIASTGAATLTDYTLQKTISDIVTLGVSSCTRGRFMRVGIKAGVGSPAASSCSIEAIRRRQRTS